MRSRSRNLPEQDRPLSVAGPEEDAAGSIPLCRLLPSFIFFCLLLPFVFFSCTDVTRYHSYKPLPAEGWDRSDTVCFHLPEAEEDADGMLIVGLRTAAHVGMQDVVLVVERCGAPGSTGRRDTILYPLTDSEGFALTKGVNHHQYETQCLPYRMRKGLADTIRIRHVMSRETIVGITELGIRIDR